MLPELFTEIPGPRSRSLAQELRRFESRNVTFVADSFPIFWDRAEGGNVWDVDGNRFLDVTSAFAVTGLGHTHPEVRAAAQDQAGRLLHAMGDVHPTEGKVRLCRELSAITFERWGAGEAKTLLANSGSEAVEAALKTALLATGRPGVLSFEGGYHGLGHGALETVGIPYFREPFVAQLARFGVRQPFAHAGFSTEELTDLERGIEGELARHAIGAILVEPLQGRGGEIEPHPEFLPMLRRIADAHRVVLIFDEIYTGFNRTGRLFAAEWFGVVPDLICLGKGMASGFPISACVGRSRLMDAWPESGGEALHTSTFLGNPVGCAMALASIAAHLRPETAATVGAAARVWQETLHALNSPLIREVRGRGLMWGVELTDSSVALGFVPESLRCGLIALAGGPQGNVLSFTPPFDLAEAEIRWVGRVVQEYLTSRLGSIS